MKKRMATKAALAFSICLFILWGILGTGSTITWFADTTPTVRNNLVIPKLDIEVSYKNDTTNGYQPLQSNVAVFNDQALYEPGYTQVVYLKIENAGDLPFQHKMSVKVDGFVDSTNYYGENLHLPGYLRFGVVFGTSEPELDRMLAQLKAEEELKTYRQL